jgi:hypothetical protein
MLITQFTQIRPSESFHGVWSHIGTSWLCGIFIIWHLLIPRSLIKKLSLYFQPFQTRHYFLVNSRALSVSPLFLKPAKPSLYITSKKASFIFSVAFKIYDIDKDGYISNGELFQVLKMMVGSNLKDAQLQQIVDKTIIHADVDKDGKISFDEFCTVSNR